MYERPVAEARKAHEHLFDAEANMAWVMAWAINKHQVRRVWEHLRSGGDVVYMHAADALDGLTPTFYEADEADRIGRRS